MRYGDYTHEQSFTQGSLKQILRLTGFRKINCYEDNPPVHGFISLLRCALWKIIRGFFCFIHAAETGSKNEIFSQNFTAVAVKK
ncbi:hypothetical protein AKJ60_00030 [candidate division MSBL1 archaeon SCGC-AAA385M11]|nr:hypothetical protein AKJ60_00030 [candidate division MSBL1 archaeon SCGC-AAA385M11]